MEQVGVLFRIILFLLGELLNGDSNNSCFYIIFLISFFFYFCFYFFLSNVSYGFLIRYRLLKINVKIEKKNTTTDINPIANESPFKNPLFFFFLFFFDQSFFFAFLTVLLLLFFLFVCLTHMWCTTYTIDYTNEENRYSFRRKNILFLNDRAKQNR